MYIPTLSINTPINLYPLEWINAIILLLLILYKVIWYSYALWVGTYLATLLYVYNIIPSYNKLNGMWVWNLYTINYYIREEELSWKKKEDATQSEYIYLAYIVVVKICVLSELNKLIEFVIFCCISSQE